LYQYIAALLCLRTIQLYPSLRELNRGAYAYGGAALVTA
jgi:hypothetical protein